ncbi:hypothetical protein PV-S19_0427 [Pacmanvirus S19]|nr:hypothetical protein PV-S19_0427 [Pacmanvirus S19]
MQRGSQKVAECDERRYYRIQRNIKSVGLASSLILLCGYKKCFPENIVFAISSGLFGYYTMLDHITYKKLGNYCSHCVVSSIGAYP